MNQYETKRHLDWAMIVGSLIGILIAAPFLIAWNQFLWRDRRVCPHGYYEFVATINKKGTAIDDFPRGMKDGVLWVRTHGGYVRFSLRDRGAWEELKDGRTYRVKMSCSGWMVSIDQVQPQPDKIIVGD